MPQRGRFITLEGPEGGGKTTQAQRLLRRLERAGHDVLYTREPGGTPLGEVVRDLLQHQHDDKAPCPESEVLLFAASRAQLVRTVILPALERGTWVVCDRFADSTTAYQGYGRGFPVDLMLTVNDFAVGAADPDLTLLLDLDVETGLSRAGHRGGKAGLDRIEQEATSFHQRVRDGYLALAARWPERFQVLTADAPPEVVEEAVWKAVCDALQP